MGSGNRLLLCGACGGVKSLRQAMERAGYIAR